MAQDIYMLIQKKYTELQKQAQDACNAEIAELYLRHPRLKSLTDLISESKGQLIRLELKRQPAVTINEMQSKINAFVAEKKKYIMENNIDMSVFTPKYQCSECNDTGKLANGSRCSCFTDHYAQLKFAAQDLSILERENFDTFDINIFPETSAGNIPQREQMSRIKTALEGYCQSFPDVQKKNILITGKTGTGKSFLLNCIAKALADRNVPVIRLSAYKMINELFDKYIDDSTDFNSELERLCETELLIIDDLGTELMKENFTHNTLYYILDRRCELGKATIVSTNLNVKQLEDKYSDRIMSRLFNARTTTALQLQGADIRIKR